jgi:hypothetical protein
VIGHPILREVIGPDLLCPLATANLTPSQTTPLRLDSLLLDIIEPRPEHRHGLRLVLELRLLVLAGHDEAGRNMRDPDRGVGCVHALAAVPGRTVDIDP